MSKRKHDDDGQAPERSNKRSHPSPQASNALRSTRDYADTDTTPAPEGPYSYVVEKRQTLYSSGARTEDGDGISTRTKGPRYAKHQAKAHTAFGQTSAFPEPQVPSAKGAEADIVVDANGGSIDKGSVLEDDDDDRLAWDYLRTVREEAEGLPTVFNVTQQQAAVGFGAEKADALAPSKDLKYGDPTKDLNVEEGEIDETGAADYDEGYDYDIDEEQGYDESGAYFSDGAWIAGPTADNDVQHIKSAQDFYYDLLCRRFHAHRQKLRALVREAQDRVGSKKRTGRSLIDEKFSSTTLPHERRRIESLGAPTTQILAALDTADILMLLAIAEEDVTHYISHKKELPSILGQYTWALLGILNDVGELNSVEVGVVRDLGKRAGWALCQLRLANDHGETSQGGGWRGPNDAAETGRQTDLSAGPSREATLALLHFIITVAGEFYGQRDLLDARLRWDAR